jgi:hypothetical protein
LRRRLEKEKAGQSFQRRAEKAARHTCVMARNPSVRIAAGTFMQCKLNDLREKYFLPNEKLSQSEKLLVDSTGGLFA